MARKFYKDQEELNKEFVSLTGFFGSSPCLLVSGDVPPLDSKDLSLDDKLKEAIKKQLELLSQAPGIPRLILYQLATGQQSIICLAKSINGSFVFSYRDMDSRPPTQRIRFTVQAACDEFGKD